MIAAVLALGGCSLFHDGYPGDSCDKTSDCFQGRETCDTTRKVCVPIDTPDARPPSPDGAPQPDAAGQPDAAPPDAAPVDAI